MMRDNQSFDVLMKNLNDQIRSIEERTQKGLMKAALLIKRESQLLCPVDTGNLKASAYVYGSTSTRSITTVTSEDTAGVKAGLVKKGTGTGSTYKIIAPDVSGPWVVIGYAASYAVFVHEGSGSHMKYDKRSQTMIEIGQRKFLETPIKNNYDRIIDIIREEARV